MTVSKVEDFNNRSINSLLYYFFCVFLYNRMELNKKLECGEKHGCIFSNSRGKD